MEAESHQIFIHLCFLKLWFISHTKFSLNPLICSTDRVQNSIDRYRKYSKGRHDLISWFPCLNHFGNSRIQPVVHKTLQVYDKPFKDNGVYGWAAWFAMGFAMYALCTLSFQWSYGNHFLLRFFPLVGSLRDGLFYNRQTTNSLFELFQGRVVFVFQ